MLLVALLAIGGVAPSAAHAQEDFQRALDTAVELYESLEYEQALEQLQIARRLARSVEQEVSVSLHEGIVLGELGQRDQSQAAFKKGLLLNPKAELPLKVSPKLESDFETMRGQALEELARGDAAPPSVAETDLPKRPDLSAPPVETPAPFEPTLEAGARTRVPVVPVVLAGVGVAAVGLGTVFGLQSRSSVSGARQAQFQDESRSRLEEARSSARVANVLFGTAGLAATGAVMTFLLSKDSEAPAEKEAR